MNFIKLINLKLIQTLSKYRKVDNLYRSIYSLNNNSSFDSKYVLLLKNLNYRRISNVSDISLFNSSAEKLFVDINNKLIDLCDMGVINDIDCHDEFMNITFNMNGEIHIIVISKQIATKQIWYSSSLRKPDYFDFNNNWRSRRSKKTVYETLKEDIYTGTGINVEFEEHNR